MDAYFVSKSLGARMAADKEEKESSRAGAGVTIGVIIALCIGAYAGYLSWSSNSLVDRALTSVAPGAATGGLTNFLYAINAFFNGISYIMYYLLFKRKRVAVLNSRFL